MDIIPWLGVYRWRSWLDNARQSLGTSGLMMSSGLEFDA
jgi:hypothetical protein